MESRTIINLTYLACFIVILVWFIGCGSLYEGTYDADVKLVYGDDPSLAMIGGGKETEIYTTWIYITCPDRNRGCYVSRIGVDRDSTLYVNFGIIDDGPFVNKQGSIRKKFYCGSYPGIDHVQICVRPFKKVK